MDAASFLSDTLRAGIVLESDGNRITVRPASRLTDGQREFIRKHKPELLAALAAKPEAAPAEAFALVRAWLQALGESDAATVAEVLDLCRADPETLRYHAARASEPLPDHPPASEADLDHAERVAEAIRAGWTWHKGQWFAPGTWKPADADRADPPPTVSVNNSFNPHVGAGAGRVACRDCWNFQRDPIGDGSGIGRCAKLADPPGGLLYPRIERRCGEFEANTSEAAP
jgi:hypothetical protein